MNLVFHTAFSVSTSTFFTKKVDKTDKTVKYLSIGFASNVIMHGVMDLLPHNYPVSTFVDVFVSFAFFLFSILFIKREYITTVGLCFLGGVLPDLIDKGLFRILRIRSFKLFPWHWPNVINYFYKWYIHASLFKIFNILALLVSVILLWINREFILKHMLKKAGPPA